MVANTPERHQKVDRSPIRVPAAPLRAQHRDHARGHLPCCTCTGEISASSFTTFRKEA